VRYAAFISYSHAADGRLAPELRLALQRFAKRWYQRRALSVVLDEATLGVSPQLWLTIESKLRDSEYLVLFACPEAACSEAVAREVDYWLRHRSADRVLIVITGGRFAWDDVAGSVNTAETDCLPPRLVKAFAQEPLWLDLRWARNEPRLSLTEERFRDAVASLAATLRGQDKDDLLGVDIEQHRKLTRVAWSVAAVLAVLLVSLGVVTYYAVGQRDAALRQEAIAQQEARAAQARLLANRAEQSLVENPDRSVLFALESLRNDATPEARDILRRALVLFPRLAATISYGRDISNLTDIQFGPDGKTLAMATSYGAYIWHAGDGEMATALDLEVPRVPRITFTSDGTALLVLARDGLYRWSLTKQRSIADFKQDFAEATLSRDTAHVAWRDWRDRIGLVDLNTDAGIRYLFDGNEGSTSIRHLALSHDGAYLAGDAGHSVYVWETETGKLIRLIGDVEADEVDQLVFAPQSYEIAVLRNGASPVVELWDAAAGRLTTRLPHPVPVTESTLEFSSDGTYLATGDRDGSAHVWATASGELAARLVHGNRVDRIAFSADDRRLATAGGPVVHLWSLPSGERLYRIPFASAPQRLAFTPDGHWLAAGGAGVIQVWDLVAVGTAQRRPLPGPIEAIALSPDTRLVATGDDAGHVSLWSVEEGRSVTAFELPPAWMESAVVRAAFSSDGQYFVTSGLDDTTAVWDLQTGAEVGRMRHPGIGSGLNLGPRGRFVAGLMGSSQTGVWDVGSGRMLGTVSHEQSFWRPLFSSNGSHVAVRSGERLLLWRLPDLDQATEITQPENITAVAFSGTGHRVATASEAGAVRVWDVNSGAQVAILEHPAAVRDLEWSGDGAALFSDCDDRLLRRWEVTSGRVDAVLHEDELKRFVASPDGERLASVDQKSTVRVWDVAQGKLLFSVPSTDTQLVAFSPDGVQLAVQGEHDVQIFDVLTGRRAFEASGLGSITAFAFSGSSVVVGRTDGTAVVWDLTGQIAPVQVQHTQNVGGPKRGVEAIAFSGNGRRIAVAGDLSAQVRDLVSGTELARVQAGGFGAGGLALDAEGKRLLTGDSSSEVQLWDVATGRTEFQGQHDGMVTAVALGPDGQFAAAGGAVSNVAEVWRLSDGDIAFRAVHPSLRSRRSRIDAVSFSSDGSYLATGGGDGTTRLWDLRDGHEVSTVTHGAPILDIAFGPESQRIATAGLDKIVRLWDVRTGQAMEVLRHFDRLAAVRFSPDGRQLVSADEAGVVWVWSLEADELVADACTRISRNLTYTEWIQVYGDDAPYDQTCSQLPLHPSLLEAMANLARSGAIERARAGFARAHALDPKAAPDATAAFQAVAQGVLSDAEELAREGQVADAVAKYDLAQRLDERLDYESVQMARQNLLRGRFDDYEKHLREDEFTLAFTDLAAADDAVPGVRVTSEDWNRLCWAGSVHRRPGEVMEACDRAVAAANPEDRPYYRDSRGLARALTGDYNGAIEDFEAFVNWARGHAEVADLVVAREDWIATLTAGKDPFADVDIRQLQ